MILQHFSDKPLTLDQLYNVDTKLQSIGLYKKPTGLWISVKGIDDWLHWCDENDFNVESVCHNLEIDWEHILVIDDDEKFNNFDNGYHIDLFNLHNIHWPKVAKDYSGIIIAPYFNHFRLDMVKSWYYTWDCASGCIWNAKDVVKKITVV
jgi:hypothetical protein